MPDISGLTGRLDQANINPDAKVQNEAFTTVPESNGAQRPTAGPAPPPSNPAALDDLLADLNRHPLFMTSLDETDGAGGTNPGLDALRSLAYEGTKAEVAENFRQQGNDCAKVSRWGDAREFYTRALDVLAGKVEGEGKRAGNRKKEGKEPTLRERLDGDVGEREVDWLDGAEDVSSNGAGKVVDLEEEASKERKIEEACVSNRAKCNLELKNYGKTTRDCLHALRLNPANQKAYYRSALALLALDKTDLARRTTNLGLLHVPIKDTTYSAFTALQKRIDARAALLEKAEAERAARHQKEAMEKATLIEALKRRKISVTSSATGLKPDLEDATVGLADALNPDSELHFPLFVLYPTVARSELIKSVGEDSTIGDLTDTVLPVPWEGGGAFGGGDGKEVRAFVETGTGGLRKVGMRVSWKKVLADGGCKVEDGLCRIMLVPKDEVEAWIQEWKTRDGR